MPLGDYDSEEELLSRPVRFSLDLEPDEYAHLCDIICSHRKRGHKTSMRALIRTAIHRTYPTTEPQAVVRA